MPTQAPLPLQDEVLESSKDVMGDRYVGSSQNPTSLERVGGGGCSILVIRRKDK